MELRKLVEDYLKEAKLMQLATSFGNQPWVCSVWFASDEDLDIYWISSENRRHSKEVMKNQKVAAAIVLPQTPQDVPRGLQFQGIAELLENEDDVDKAVALFSGRIFPKEKIKEFMDSKTNPHKFYRIKVEKFVLFDVANFPDNPRQELKLFS